MENSEIARVFIDIANLLEMSGENPFRVRSYRNAAEIMESLTVSLESVASIDDKRLEDIPGIGKSIHEKIVEIVKTGDCALRNDLLKIVPKGLLDVIKISGIGPKKAVMLNKKLGITNVTELEAAVNAHKLADLPGLGEKSEDNIRRALEAYKTLADGAGRVSLAIALPTAFKYMEYLKENAKITSIDFAGSLRRWKETVGDIDLLVVAKEASQAIEAFVAYRDVHEVLQKGDTKASVRLKSGVQADLRVLEKKSYGAALQYFTGSKSHNVELRDRAKRMGLKISEYGVFDEKTGDYVAGKTEEEVYEAVGLQWIAPEMRENLGEIELAEKKKLPELIEAEDLKGDLHCHTTLSDGANSLAEMSEAAMRRGYEYIAVTDHSKAVGIASGLDEKRLRKSMSEVDKFNAELKKKKKNFMALKGAEVDIKADGTLDYDKDVLGELDIVVAAVHSGFNMRKEEMTKRVVKALESGYVHVLAHPTGRLINSRPGYELDMQEVVKAAKKNNVALELNSYPLRLDINDVNCRLAKESGVKVVISTDAHSIVDYGNIIYGLHTARRGWLGKNDVLNSMTLGEILKHLKER